MDEETGTSSAKEVELSSHGYGSPDRGPEAADSGLDGNGERGERIIKAVREFDQRPGFKEGGEVKTQVCGVSGFDAVPKWKAQDVESNFGSE